MSKVINAKLSDVFLEDIDREFYHLTARGRGDKLVAFQKYSGLVVPVPPGG